MAKALGDFEKLILLALLRLEDSAYGAAIREEIQRRTGRDVAIGAVYTALERLERKGFVASRVGDPTPERGGRRKKFYRGSPLGAKALGRSCRAFWSMAEGLKGRLESL